MKMRALLMLICICPAAWSFAQHITVKQDGSGDFTKIQHAVDSASNGDTVLVWPGTYFESVLIENKNIILGSLTLTTGDLSYIKQTRIDCSSLNSGSPLAIQDCSDTNIVNGFILTNGKGTWNGSIDGGGIFIRQSNTKVYNCIIQNNQVIGSGGGIYIMDSTLFLSAVTIKDNYSYTGGGGIKCASGNLIFDSVNPCNIYLNYAPIGTDIYKSLGSPVHLWLDTCTVSNPDSYYMFSNIGQIYPAIGTDITYNINEGKIENVYQNVFVSPEGSNNNSGLSALDPLKNIWFALLKLAPDSISPDTIHLLNGIYSISGGEKYPLGIKGYTAIKGQSKDSVILDAEHEIYHIRSLLSDYYYLGYMTLTNGNGNLNSPYEIGAMYASFSDHCLVEHVLFTENLGHLESAVHLGVAHDWDWNYVDFKRNIGANCFTTGHGGLQYPRADTIRIYNCHFIENKPDTTLLTKGWGGGAEVIGVTYNFGEVTTVFNNCLFAENSWEITPNWATSNSLVVWRYSESYVNNCTFGNSTSNSLNGANIVVDQASNLRVYNSVFYNNQPAEFLIDNSKTTPTYLGIFNSLVEGGQDSIRIENPVTVLTYDKTNIDADPLWDTASLYPYSLSAGSPCIDAGTMILPPEVEILETDLAGNPRVWGGNIDMGAYEYGPWVNVDEVPGVKAQNSNNLRTYPNPFREKTTIFYEIPASGNVKIEVYNMKGLLVSSPLNADRVAGKGSFQWNMDSGKGNSLLPGTYVLKLIYNGKDFADLTIVKVE